MSSTESTGRIVPLFINGEALPVNHDRLRPVTNSASGEVVHKYVAADVDACNAACESAWNAFSGKLLDTGRSGWKRASVATRRDIILKAVSIFESRKQELLNAQMQETACAMPWAMNNYMTTMAYMREIAACVSSIKGEIPPNEKPDTFAFVFKEPVGPVLIIPPWNAALILATRAVTGAIGAGCTVVLKGSELCPLTHSLIVDIYKEAGLPAGVINTVFSDRENAPQVTEALIANERIRKVEFIGSAAVGRVIGAVAAKHLKPVLMELGGKCPAIVLDDANLRKAAAMCAIGATLHHGQICFSTERIIVLKSVAKEFQEYLIAEFQKAHSGTAVHAGIADKALDLLKEAKDKGHEFIVGGPEMVKQNGLKPSVVLVDAKTSKDALKLLDEESFSPTASLYVVEDDAEAVRLANASAYGLNATIHSNNMERALKMGQELEYGQVHVNSVTLYVSPTGSQGGVKGSGWGRQNAHWGLEEYLKEKFVTFQGKDSAM